MTNKELKALKEDKEVQAFVKFWTTRTKTKVDYYCGKFQDESVAKKLAKFLKKIKD